MTPSGKAPLALTVIAAIALSTGCAADGDEASSDKEETPHGYIEGAEETAEPQWRLVAADGRSGDVKVIDPATEKVTDVGTVKGVRSVIGDGRFAYFATEDAVHVVDSGAWTVDHGDHVHYYRTTTRSVGAFEGRASAVASDPAVTVLSSADGVRLLDRSAMEEGEVGTPEEISGARGLPFGGRVLVPADNGAGTVEVVDRDGTPASTLDDPCREPDRQALTRRGAVFGCSDGALLVTEDDDESLSSEKIPYPEQAESRPDTDFRHRPGTPVLTAEAGDTGFWALDIAAKEWTFVAAGPVVAVSAVGEDAPLLALTDDGVLRSYDPETGEESATRELMHPLDDGDGPAPTIQIDTGRAYVNDPGARAIHEIDYNDGLRIARTFDLDFAPDHMVETGW